MDRDITLFGTELRRARLEAGVSLTGLAKLVHYSKGHLSKVETGAKPPSEDLARRCDSALSCHGGLAGLVRPRAATRAADQDGESGEVWVLRLDDEGMGFQAVTRRRLLLAGTAVGAMAGAEAVVFGTAGFGAPLRRPAAAVDAGDAGGQVAAFRAMFDQLRGLGQLMAPAALMPTLIAQTHALGSLAAGARGPDRTAVLSLAARFAEFTGWMAQEAGDDGSAAWWTDRAVGLAQEAGETDMAAYALVRKGLIALYRHDAAQTVALAHRAGESSDDLRIRGLAAQREAQGLAVAGDYDGCARALDRAAELLAGAADPRRGPVAQVGGGAAPVVGTTNIADPIATATGWCLYDLGDTRRAAEVLRGQYDRIPVGALRARARYGARLALALAGSGEPEEAAVTVAPVLDACARIDSATVRMDLRALAREFNRWPNIPEIRDVRARLTAELNTSGPHASA